MPSLLDHRRVSNPLDRGVSRVATSRLVQDAVAALGEAVMGGGFVKLREFGLEMLVDEQQGPQRATEIAAAIGHDLVDRRVIGSETHRNPLPLKPCETNCGDRSVLAVDDVDRSRDDRPISNHLAVRKRVDHGYKKADDARMTQAEILRDSRSDQP